VKKYFLLFAVLGLSLSGYGQKISKINLLSSEYFSGLKLNGEDALKVMKPVFQQDNSTLTCDSAYFYINRNTFDAFGHVHINQADTVNIFSDLLDYNGNTKMAILTNNVRLVDKGAVLTTNNLTYNMASKVGQYTNGGKIVNGENTLTSTNGYYFSNSSDAYFRYNVRVKTPEVLILSDTLRYNSLTKISYFYGPTNIYGKEDTLYTENGTYNTSTDQAAFGKKNLYRQNSKSLKGDSLFYDGKVGYGRAVKNILFKDTAQKIELRGNLGYYLKKDESITVTKNAYVVFETEKDSISKDSIWMSADTLYSKVLTKGELYTLRKSRIVIPPSEDDLNLIEDESSDQNPIDTINNNVFIDSLNNNELPIQDSISLSKDSLNVTGIDSLNQKQIEEKPLALSKKELRKIERKRKKETEILALVPTSKARQAKNDEQQNEIQQDSIAIKAYERSIFLADSLSKDSIRILEQDTAKVRIVSAWRNVKLFKSDLQAKSDSAFFSYGDSTLRIFQNPILWAQGNQMTADTMNLQMLNNKLDNMDMIRNAIIVNTKDSVYFNQVTGKTMKGYFKNDKLDRVFVDGNAESIYFSLDSASEKGMLRTISARMRINFLNDSLSSVLFLLKPEMTYYVLDNVTEELKTLPNFSWKPKERPSSKEEVISSAVIAPTQKTTDTTNNKSGTKQLAKPAAIVPALPVKTTEAQKEKPKEQ
jgi:lipopolysaccharide export system protein LptA